MLYEADIPFLSLHFPGKIVQDLIYLRRKDTTSIDFVPPILLSRKYEYIMNTVEKIPENKASVIGNRFCLLSDITTSKSSENKFCP